jgi:hypothetical protein
LSIVILKTSFFSGTINTMATKEAKDELARIALDKANEARKRLLEEGRKKRLEQQAEAKPKSAPKAKKIAAKAAAVARTSCGRTSCCCLPTPP